MTIRGTTLVLGGARSGKSGFAEGLVRATGLPVRYVATATAGDDEMHQRIAHHRTQRDPAWPTTEEPLALLDVLMRESNATTAILIDCLTLWLSNLMEAGRDVPVESRRLADWLSTARSPVVLVSNEVGMGLVPETPLGRDFRDAQGRLNQMVAAVVDNVAFVAAGLPLWLKGGSD
jgi:adenosylcobinamide kinase/adenosylcobinamide-phosphate guanylyltransferase